MSKKYFRVLHNQVFKSMYTFVINNAEEGYKLNGEDVFLMSREEMIRLIGVYGIWLMNDVELIAEFMLGNALYYKIRNIKELYIK